jgi:hypothetical protein
MKFLQYSLVLFLGVFWIGCSTSSLVTTQNTMPPLYEDGNVSHQKNITISLFRLNNYTDTPRAGMRASNIIEGVLKAKGYTVVSHLETKTATKKDARESAIADGSEFFMFGGVSEWRYKTGIDGEPAVSLQLSLYKTQTQELVWSATASDSDWGNASIGTTAQDLIEKMVSN